MLLSVMIVTRTNGQRSRREVNCLVRYDFGTCGDSSKDRIKRAYNCSVDQAEALKKARQFADLAFSAAMNDAAREFNTKLRSVKAELALRGTALTGSMTAATARLTGERVSALTTKRLELLLEGCELHGVEITDQVAEQILRDVMQYRTSQIAKAASTDAKLGADNLPGASGPHYAQLLEQHIPVTHASLKTEIDRRRLMRKKSDPTQMNVYHVYGHQPRWITNGTDNSVNIVNAKTEQIFANLREQIAEKIPAGDERSDILSRLTELEQAQSTPSFGKRYADFIAAAANHMALVAPFIPALTELLSRTIT